MNVRKPTRKLGIPDQLQKQTRGKVCLSQRLEYIDDKGRKVTRILNEKISVSTTTKIGEKHVIFLLTELLIVLVYLYLNF